MERRTWVILSLIFSVLSLVYILMDYFGLIRYFRLHNASHGAYVKAYAGLDKADPDNRVVISITTTPDGLSKIKPVLLSLIDQTVRVDEIALNIPYAYQNAKMEKYEVPKYLEEIVNVYRSGKDYGKTTKVIPTMLRESGAKTKIIFLDDDMIYGKDFIEDLVTASLNNKGDAIYVSGWNANADVLRSRMGVLIEPNFVDADIVKGTKLNTDADIWVSGHLKKRNTKAKKIEYTENYGAMGYRRQGQLPLTRREKIAQLKVFWPDA
jgi:hypothetical protein